MKKFISFLGTGKNDKGYDFFMYKFGNKISQQTQYVQEAELELLRADGFDKIIIFCTKKSKKEQYGKLESCLTENLNIPEEKIVAKDNIPENLTPEKQWEVFEEINNLISDEDEIVFDFTHGYRSFPIIISAAINFILKSKKHITLGAVLYGQEVKDNEEYGAEIIDMKDFYVINEWADAVNRLVENADTSKLIELAENSDNRNYIGFKDEELLKSLKILTDNLYNVNVNDIAQATREALSKITEKIKDDNTTETGRRLLEMVVNKFTVFMSNTPPTGKYDADYFRLQIKIIDMLIEHNLLMQAFTVMRELVGSIGVLGAKKKYKNNMNSGNGKKGRKKADIFIRMVENEESEWKFNEHAGIIKESLLPFYKEIFKLGILENIKSVLPKITKLRNGFDHAWTATKPETKEKMRNAKEEAEKYSKDLDKIIDDLISKKLVVE